jgi:hypothetical protein
LTLNGSQGKNPACTRQAGAIGGLSSLSKGAVMFYLGIDAAKAKHEVLISDLHIIMEATGVAS